MPEQGDHEIQVDPKTEAEIKSINVELSGPSEHGPMFDGFVNMYNVLPEKPFAHVIKSNLLINWPEQHSWKFKPVANYCGKLMVKDIVEQSEERVRPVYNLLHGSFFVPEEDLDTKGQEIFKKAVPELIDTGKSFIGTYKAAEGMIRVAYSANSFCKDAVLAYSKAHLVFHLRDVLVLAEIHDCVQNYEQASQADSLY